MSMTVLQVLPEMESGGVERGTLEVAQALVRAGHKAIVISAGGKMVRDLEQSGGIHVAYPVGKKTPLTFIYAWAIRNFLLAQHVDVIDVRSRLPAWVVILALKLLPAKERPALITTVHGAYSVSRYSAVMTKGDRVVAVSDFIKQYILENYPETDKQKITVIPRGVSSKEYYREFKPKDEWLKQWSHEHASLKDKSIITLPGRISELKGQDDFLLIIKKLLDKGVDIHGLIAGGAGNHKKSLLKKLKHDCELLGLSEHIHFLGDRKDLREIMFVSDIVLSLSHKPESFGRTIVEAIALGKPVVAYDHGGAREILEGSFQEGLVPANNIARACDVIETLVHKKSKISEPCPFTLEVMLDETIKLYESCCRAPLDT